jgi:DNA-directed RNA polymerase subunit H
VVIIARKSVKKKAAVKPKKESTSKKVSKPTKKPVKVVKKAPKKEKKEEFIVETHILVPKHTKLNEKQKQDLLEKYKISLNELPKISMKDAPVSHMELTTDDVIMIERPSPTSKNTVFYRRVTK